MAAPLPVRVVINSRLPALSEELSRLRGPSAELLLMVKTTS
jgi:hypothetical protein